MARESEGVDGKVRDGLSRDKRRLALGLLLMALLLGTTLISVFMLGRPTEGRLAPGVPFLVGSGWTLVLASAVVFYRSYSGEPGDGAAPERDASAPRGSGGDLSGEHAPGEGAGA